MERFRDVLTGLRGQIPESLVAGPGWEHLLDRVGDLPAAAASSLCGFEFRLDEPAPAADFSGPASRGRVARHYIARGEAAATPSTEAWLAGRLRDPSATDRWLESVLLAYDIIGTTPERPAPPVVYLGMRFPPPGGEGGGWPPRPPRLPPRLRKRPRATTPNPSAAR